MATTPEEAARIIAATDYGMPIAGPYTPNDKVERRAPSTFAPTPGSTPKKGTA
jgi:hypothetical protein